MATNFQITSPQTNGQYIFKDGLVNYKLQLSDSNSEDFNFLRVCLQYAAPGTPSTSTAWAKFHECPIGQMSLTSGYYGDYFSGLDLPPGTWQIRAVVDDDMMEGISPNVINIIIDRNAPTSFVSTITPVESNHPYWNTYTKTITATANDPDGSGVKDVKLYYSFSSTLPYTWSSYTPFGSTDTTTPYQWNFNWPNGNGYYKFYSIATDYMNYVETTPTSYDQICGYDTTPSTPQLSTPLYGTSIQDTTPTFDWQTISTDLSGIVSYRLQVDDSNSFGSTLIDITTPSTQSDHTPTTAMSTGITWYWRVSATDTAGNTAWSAPNNFVIVLPAPTASVIGYVHLSTGYAVPGATVSCSSGVSVPTNTANGYYSITVAVGGPYTFTASAIGYYDEYYTNSVPSGGLGHNFVLTAIPPPPPDPNPVCFVKGTMIATLGGEMPIESITVGDYVLSFNETTGVIEPNKVLKTFSHLPQEYLLINNALGVTGNHIIYVNGWLLPAKDIKLGDILTTLEGYEQVTSIELITQSLDVYNIEVENNHNFYAEGILVHNKGPIPDPDPGSPGWCPFVYAWNGTDFAEENNLMPESTNYARETLDVVDYYTFMNPLVEKDGIYPLMLYENWTERTQFDEVKLVTVDCPADYNGFVDIGSDGTVETANYTIEPTSVFNETGVNIIDLTIDIDNLCYNAEANDIIALSFETGNCENPKLVVYHKTGLFMVKPYTYYPIPGNDPDLKCSIHVQTLQGNAWVDIATIPARINWICDIVNLSAAADYLENGGEIRLLVTGRHYIDYIGMDVTDESVPIIVSYISPVSARYSGIDTTERVSLITLTDGDYLQMNPGQCINVSFPCVSSETGNRFYALKIVGHYYTVPTIDLVQPVTIEATVSGSLTGNVTFMVEEVVGNTIFREQDWQTVDLSLGSKGYIAFDQEAEKRYRLAVSFDGCAPGTKATVVIRSLRGAQNVECVISDSTIYFSLNDILWNVTGARFDELSSRYQVLKDTVLMFEVNRDYGWNLTGFDTWNWNFGDGSWTNDRHPTHVYEALGVYVLNLTFANSTTGSTYEIGALVEVVSSPPIPIAEIYQDVELTLTVSGRKGNSVSVRVYEDGALVNSADVVRTTGCPNSVTLVMKKCLGKIYEIKLIYDAQHKGANPTWLEFRSGGDVLTFFKEFNTCHGYDQTVTLPSFYLDEATKKNPSYHFDASESYDIDGEVVSYLWEYGDETMSSGLATEHRYSHNGVYIARLTVTDDDGLTTTVEREITITTFRPPFRPPPRRCGPGPR